ncbi:MAG: hypothetical protein K2N25_02845 [Muribaculaceae bacterium]|nr:hypothetical protein [Muribaculaceae bacterium]
MNKSIVAGQAATVTALANATGGLNAGNFVEPDIDQQLFSFNSDDTPLMNLMLRAKRVKVNSPEVDHFMIDEPKSTLTTTADVGGGTAQAIIPVRPGEENLPRQYTTLLVKGVDGYDESGKNPTPGKYLMVFVVGHDAASGCPIVRPVNGRKMSADDEVSLMPAIPEGTKLVLLANSLYETQKEVDPDLIVPQPTRIYLQKRGMNQVVSDYFESQRKRTPFSKAVVAEQAIANFKVRGNRTLWAGRAGKFQVNVPNLGMQTVYSTEGIRWQFKRELQHTGRWTVEKIIALAKMFFTGEDVPKTALLLAGKDLLEQIQCVDFSRHPEIQITTKTNSIGWSVTNFHTVFGDIEIKREPTLDRLGWSHSGALIGEDRLVHYVYSAEHSFQDRMEGHEASRSGILIWDALALKGSCHIWIDGEGEAGGEGSECLRLWDDTDAPDAVEGIVYYLVNDCMTISASAKSGTMWTNDGSGWKEYSGEITVG